jgi:hypothetical protein
MQRDPVRLTSLLALVPADTPSRIREAHRLRYRLHGGRGDALEVDEHDWHARQFIVRDRVTRRGLGVIRVIEPHLRQAA